MENEVRQPFILNNNGTTVEEIFGKSAKDIMTSDDDSAESKDHKFALSIFTLVNDKAMGTLGVNVLSAFISAIYEKRFTCSSEIAEHLTNAITNEDERDKITMLSLFVRAEIVSKSIEPSELTKATLEENFKELLKKCEDSR